MNRYVLGLALTALAAPAQADITVGFAIAQSG